MTHIYNMPFKDDFQTKQKQGLEVQHKVHRVESPQGDSTTAQMVRKGAMTVLSEYINESRLKTIEPTPQSLEMKGFIKSKGPLDGAAYYRNANTGEKIRVKSNTQNGNTCYEYQNGNMQHSVIYDKNGKAIRGDVQIKEKDGSLTIIKYEFDENGNKVITDVKTAKCESQSEFIRHDGEY